MKPEKGSFARVADSGLMEPQDRTVPLRAKVILKIVCVNGGLGGRRL